MLSQVTDFNFNWHNMYIYDDDVAPLLPKGTILHLLAWYDNTKANKSNPDPDQWVGWGDRTVDEMGHAWLNITYYNDDEFKAGDGGARGEDGQHDGRRRASSSSGFRSRQSRGAVRIRAAPFFRYQEWRMRVRQFARAALLLSCAGGVLGGAQQGQSARRRARCR